MEFLGDIITSSLKDNPYFSAGAGLFGVGVGMAALRRLGQLTNLVVRRNFTLTLEVPSHDKAYPWVLHWITSRAAGRTSGVGGGGGPSQHLSVETSVVRSEGGRIRAAFDFVPSTGVHYMFHQGRIIRIERVRAQQTMQGANVAPFESVTLTTFGRNKQLFIELLEQARETAVAREKGWTIVYKAAGSEWRQFGYPRSRRPLDSVVLRDGVAETIVADVREFIENQAWYTERGIPYHRGYLLYGPPGCGKTSFITALAGHLDYSISVLNLSEFGMTADRLDHLLTHAPLQSIILLEDIDAAVHNREHMSANKAYEGMPTLTLSGLLNALDGVTSTDGRIIFMTTNYVDRLDAALIRPGRVDMRVHLDYCDRSQLVRMFSRFYPSPRAIHKTREDDGDAKFCGLGGASSSDPVVTLRPPIDRTHSLAVQFAAQLDGVQVSSAQVQGYLLLYKDNPTGALRNVDLLKKCGTIGNCEQPQAQPLSIV
ncbi:Mitochondrial chaperone BCS1 [Fasciola gigantica]|uniref:Mitochondrial chaperone BCS1 n=1 Tax=Fasciola gigantica TaxID=46835 RepID=A0A504YRU5_FASGI|nr:Mitochondrial chaperone BCS1 [Fasciola gigantica]